MSSEGDAFGSQMRAQNLPEHAVLHFQSPELAAGSEDDDLSGYEHKPHWDVAVRYQDLQRWGHLSLAKKQALKKRAVEGVLRRARAVMGAVIRRQHNETEDYLGWQRSGRRGEIEWDATLEGVLNSGKSISLQKVDEMDLQFSVPNERDPSLALLMDMSLSMNGEKVALLAVAVAVAALSVPAPSLALLRFSSRCDVLKPFGAEWSVSELIERVLESRSHGLTNLEAGLQGLDAEIQRSQRKRVHCILISDGKYTEGADPSPLASRFHRLHGLKLGRDRAGLPLMRELTERGNGFLFEVRRMEDLPRGVYGVIRQALRGT